jgi:hypothetical protein
MFDLQIDKKKKTKNKKLSSMNKSCEKEQQHVVKIFYMWMFCITLKERNAQRLCRIGIRQVTFDRMVMILNRTYNSFSL